MRVQRNAVPKVMPTGEMVQRWMDRLVRTEEGCWLWPGGKSGNGYAKVAFTRDGRRHFRVLHRLLYEVLRGPVDEDLQLDHLCRVRNCCNPDHLEPVTGSENLRRGVGVGGDNFNRFKTHCPKGHPYDEENTIYRSNGSRGCRTCGRESLIRRRAAAKALRAALNPGAEG
jgi:hypothetical protein